MEGDHAQPRTDGVIVEQGLDVGLTELGLTPLYYHHHCRLLSDSSE